MLYLPLEAAYIVAKTLATSYLPRHNVRILHLFNTGRCGSTLLCRALGVTGATQSISEPDVFTNLVLQPRLREHPNAQRKLCFASTILLAHWSHHKDSDKPWVC